MSNRKFIVSLNGKISQYTILQNGLFQGSILLPLFFFNIYTARTSSTVSRKFIYIDDIALLTHANGTEIFLEMELTLNLQKSVTMTFHLNNREANKQLDL